MVNSPVLSAPVQRALPGAAVAGGSVQASHGWGAFGPSEGADQSGVRDSFTPSEGADQSYHSGWSLQPSEGADQATSWGFYSAGQPSEGVEQSSRGGIFAPSEG
jgi:hypothetical protein